MTKCPECGEIGLIKHENLQVKTLINPHTGEPHNCNPANKTIRVGKWKGFTYGEMARVWYNQKLASKKDLNRIANNSNSQPDN